MRPVSYLNLLLASIVCVTSPSAFAYAIMFEKPALDASQSVNWTQGEKVWERYGLPIGNGSMGLTTYGGVKEEVIYFTLDSLWSGEYIPDADNAEAYKGLPEIRALLLEGKYDEAEETARRYLGGSPSGKNSPSSKNAGFGSFSVFGRLLIQSDLAFEQVENYSRRLNIAEAVSSVTYHHHGNTYQRSSFASYPDQLAAMRYAVKGDATQNLKISFDHPHTSGDQSTLRVVTEGRDLVITGTQPGSELVLDARIRVRAEGAEIQTGADFIEIRNAKTVEFYLVADTSYDMKVENLLGAPKGNQLPARLDRALQVSYDDLLMRHSVDYKSLYDRVSLDLGETEAGIRKLPMDERIARYRERGIDPDLEESLFQYGRYLMISSSRPGTLPANLQGIWSGMTCPPWQGDYHLDVNIQMNYWLAGSTNLLECQEPLIDFLELLQRNGRKTAQAYYNADGWAAMLASNVWGYTAPNYSVEALLTKDERGRSPPMYWNFFPTSGAWLAFHAYDQYSFGQDREMLEERLWPIVSDTADFLVDFFHKLPEGKYSAVPSWSPEHGDISLGATAAIAIGREIFTSALIMAEELGINNERTAQYQYVLKNLIPYKIGKHGQLQEWYEDRDKSKERHRHVNHLIGLFPGSQISPLTTPELAQAARTSLEQRSGMSTGWSLAWKINLMARLFDGNEAYQLTRMILESRVAPNLWTLHPPFQIDANFGATSGFAEMLLQSHLGEIHALPALPEAWPSGSVAGLRARGGFTLDIAWDAGELTALKIHSEQDAQCKVRYADRVIDLDIPGGQKIILNRSNFYTKDNDE